MAKKKDAPKKLLPRPVYLILGWASAVIAVFCLLIGVLAFAAGGWLFVLFGLLFGFLAWKWLSAAKSLAHGKTAPAASTPEPPQTSPSVEPVQEQPKAAENATEPKPEPLIMQRQAAFDAALELLPKVEIRTTGTKGECPPCEVADKKYANITTRSNKDKLGNFVVIDTETTGLDASKDKIVEVSAILFEGYEPVSAFTTLVNPERKISASASAVNRITDEMVADAPTIWQIMPALNEYVGGRTIVGHNLPFDLKFLASVGLQIGEKQRLYDTLALARKTVKKSQQKWDRELGCYVSDDEFDAVPNYKLQTLCRHYLICDHCDHRADGDALATGYLFAALVEDRTQPADI